MFCVLFYTLALILLNITQDLLQLQKLADVVENSSKGESKCNYFY
jgi:hypothetical protein